MIRSSQFIKHSEVTSVRNHSAGMHEEVYSSSLILLSLRWHTYVFDIGAQAYYGAFVRAYYGHRGIQIYRYGRSIVAMGIHLLTYTYYTCMYIRTYKRITVIFYLLYSKYSLL